MAGKKASSSTPKDMRLKANKTASTKTVPTSVAAPKFGSPAWRQKYGK